MGCLQCCGVVRRCIEQTDATGVGIAAFVACAAHAGWARRDAHVRPDGGRVRRVDGADERRHARASKDVG
ncbi:hypothetical protein BLAT2472_20152 [Burkholderia latens]